MSTPGSATVGGWGATLAPGQDQQAFDAIRSAIARRFESECEQHYVAPPVIARETVERTGYPDLFPHLLGSVHTTTNGNEPAATDLVLTPAACHHIYPLVADSAVPAAFSVSVEAVCFRAEVTSEAGRLRSFRMYEIVHLGSESEVLAWRDDTLAAAATWLRELGLVAEVVSANDPFFGRPGKFMAQVQRSQQLKWEIVAEVASGVRQALGSVNCHKEHFGEAFHVAGPDGQPAHSACLGIGLDRLLLALRHRHGLDPQQWPAELGVIHDE